MRRLVLILLLLAAGNSPAAVRSTAAAPLARWLEEPVRTLNPLCRTQMSERYVVQYLFTPLVYLDATMRPIPGVARRWSVSKDARVYTFDLDPRATFSDGTRVRASDVVFTLTKIHEPTAHNAPEFETLNLARTRALSDTTVEVVFNRALAAQLRSFADVFVLPEHVYATGNFRDDYYARAVGSGPYTLVRREEDLIILERRVPYWREAPPIPRVIFRVLQSYETEWRALQLGQLDEGYVPSFAWQKRNDPSLQRKITFRLLYGPEYSCVAWNLRRPFLQDVRVRRALAMSVPMEEAARYLYNDTARTFAGPFAPDHEGHNPAVQPLRYDPVGASRLFAEAGWKGRSADGILVRDGKPFHIELLVPGSGGERFATFLQAKLRAVGVDVGVAIRDPAAAPDAMKRGEYDAAYLQWSLDPDADFYAIFHSSQRAANNVAFYANPTVDELLDSARGELNPSRRRALCQRAHKLIADDQPYSFYLQRAATWGTSTRLRGVSVSPVRGLFLWYPGELGWAVAEKHP